MRRTLLALALSLLACVRAQAPASAHGGELLPAAPTMRWYLGANCVGTPGGTVLLARGCGDYVIFGTVLTIMASVSNVTKQWNIVTFVDAGCRGAIGVLFVNIPHTASGSAPVCIATTTADRSVTLTSAAAASGLALGAALAAAAAALALLCS